jgi:predicted DNA-binding protein
MTTPPSSARPPKPKRDLSYIDTAEAQAIVASATGDQNRPLPPTENQVIPMQAAPAPVRTASSPLMRKGIALKVTEDTHARLMNLVKHGFGASMQDVITEAIEKHLVEEEDRLRRAIELGVVRRRA